MIRADSAIVVERPPQAVFDYVATGFFQHYPRWAPEVVQLASLTPGPIRVGGLGRQVRLDFGRRTEATFRVTRLDAPTLVAFEGITQPFTIAYGFTPAGDHTRVTLIFELRRLEFFMRPFERIIRAAVRDSVAGTMKRLKATAEREIVPAGAAPVVSEVMAAPPLVVQPPVVQPLVAPAVEPPTLPPAAEPDPGLSRV